MSEREGLYCEKHQEFAPDGVCRWCEPAPADVGGYLLPPEVTAAMRQHWADGRIAIRGVPVVLDRACDHAAGYCGLRSAHKYELPEDPIAVLTEQIEQRMDDTDERMRAVLQLYGADPEE